MPDLARIFENMPQGFQADRAGNMNAAVLFDLFGEGGGQWTVNVADGQCSVQQGAVPNPTATIRMAAGDYAEMAAGRLNPVNAFMTGKVKVEGDLNTVMKFQTLFANTAA